MSTSIQISYTIDHRWVAIWWKDYFIRWLIVWRSFIMGFGRGRCRGVCVIERWGIVGLICCLINCDDDLNLRFPSSILSSIISLSLDYRYFYNSPIFPPSNKTTYTHSWSYYPHHHSSHQNIHLLSFITNLSNLLSCH